MSHHCGSKFCCCDSLKSALLHTIRSTPGVLWKRDRQSLTCCLPQDPPFLFLSDPWSVRLGPKATRLQGSPYAAGTPWYINVWENLIYVWMKFVVMNVWNSRDRCSNKVVLLEMQLKVLYLSEGHMDIKIFLKALMRDLIADINHSGLNRTYFTSIRLGWWCVYLSRTFLCSA